MQRLESKVEALREISMVLQRLEAKLTSLEAKVDALRQDLAHGFRISMYLQLLSTGIIGVAAMFYFFADDITHLMSQVPEPACSA